MESGASCLIWRIHTLRGAWSPCIGKGADTGSWPLSLGVLATAEAGIVEAGSQGPTYMLDGLKDLTGLAIEAGGPDRHGEQRVGAMGK